MLENYNSLNICDFYEIYCKYNFLYCVLINKNINLYWINTFMNQNLLKPYKD